MDFRRRVARASGAARTTYAVGSRFDTVASAGSRFSAPISGKRSSSGSITFLSDSGSPFERGRMLSATLRAQRELRGRCRDPRQADEYTGSVLRDESPRRVLHPLGPLAAMRSARNAHHGSTHSKPPAGRRGPARDGTARGRGLTRSTWTRVSIAVVALSRNVGTRTCRHYGAAPLESRGGDRT